MSHITAFVDEDAGRELEPASAEVQACLALNRAILQTLASLSPTLAGVAERALSDELDLARRGRAPSRTIELIEDARDQLQDDAGALEMMGALEMALVAAADALPDIAGLPKA
ncbi:MAG: hypothetical protein A2790_08505 [Phenylobacterium sp. RIFCSPHIGHO2_01_FULL_69_31]|uniref:hypothetical protein n=1 Tax=Phenylobacterium sp. RIFCSPHIGHO2_01_FULL_69_31 TaxID=1801944 RepID=UPI0008CCB451|nr:hypothetical protein [Phenylobacterium sp. RIFCSPHIGHO2_01_FULL_69_31]OHB30762.1 MAG: hypothetical protein A2790_08505 [Phenylobacterium sp. RIFCSPHIGHO2_01_FULL_69_31]